MRKKYTEAKSVMFFWTLGVSIVSTIALAVLTGFAIIPVPDSNELTSAIVGGDTALIGFMIAAFTMYFTYKMPEHIEARLRRHGFYHYVPRNIIYCILFLAVSLCTAIASFFLECIVRNVLVIVATAQFVTGVVMAVFVTTRFYMLLKA